MAQPKPAPQVVPVLQGPYATDTEKVNLTTKHTASLKTSPSWASATGVQTATTAWNTVSASIVTNAALILSLRKQLSDAEDQQVLLRQTWMTSARAVLTAVSLFAVGAAATIIGLGFGTRSRAPIGPLPAVLGLTSSLGKLAGQTLVEWTRDLAKHGFMVQHATDYTNQATWSVPAPCTKTKLLLSGLTSGSVIYVRVCAIDPSQPGNQAPWSVWTAASVR